MLRFRKKKSKKDKDKDTDSAQSSPREGSEEKSSSEQPDSRRSSRDSLSTFYVNQTPNDRIKTRSESFQSLWRVPEITKHLPRTTRLLHIKRLPKGDFGFTLRKGFILDRISKNGAGTASPVIFAEPGVGYRAGLTPLLPGDRLIEVNGQNVENYVREEIIELIRGTGNELSLGVQAIPELSEVNSSSGSSDSVLMRFNSVEPSHDGGDSTNDMMWLIFDNGYTTARVLGAVQGHDGVYEVETEGGQRVPVKERQLERANPESLVFSSNLGSLRYLNESSFLHTLRHRYANNLIHTFAGPTMLIMNPIYPLTIYSEKVSTAVQNCKMDLLPPHIYSLARKVYDDLVMWKRNQSVVFLGHSGSGKTTNVRHLLNYLVSNGHGRFINSQKLHTAFTILDYMLYNRNTHCIGSNRSSQAYCLEYDQSGRLCSMSIQLIVLGRQCSFRGSPNEHPVDLVSQMVTGLDANQKADLFLTGTTSIGKIIEPNKASQTWPKFAQALKTVGMNDSDIKAMCYVLGALIHLSNIRLRENEGKDKFLTLDAARRSATLLGIDLDDLARFIFDRDDQPDDVQNGDVTTPGLSPNQLMEHFINCVYSEVVNVVLAAVNRYMSSDDRIMNSVLILDTPGFKQNPGQSSSLNDLFDNYVQERLQDHYVQTTLASIVQKFDEDNVSYDYEFDEKMSMAELIHACPQLSLTPKSALKKRVSNELNRKGLFWTMEEESMLHGSTDQSFVKKLGGLGTNYIRVTDQSKFIVDHYSGECPVLYDAQGWLSDCKINRSTMNIIGLLQSSAQDFILKFLRSSHHRGARFSGLNIGSGTSSLRRTASMKFGTAGGNLSQKALMFQLRAQTDRIVDSLAKTREHFVHCIAPTEESGAIDGDAELKYCLMAEDKCMDNKDVMPDVGLLKMQVASYRLLDVVGFWKRYHPDFMRYGDFNRRYGLLAPSDPRNDNEAERVVNILHYLTIDPSSYKLGKCHVFLRREVLEKLESCRKNKVASCVVNFQAYCRGFVVRKTMQTFRSQKLAISIIQRNVRKFMDLRQWPWWRLFVKVRPLVTVNRMELELQGKDVTLSEVMEKVRKIEDERNEFRNANREAEHKLTAVLRELTEEQSCSAEISAELELERNRRIQYEKEVEALSAKTSSLASKNEQLEMNLMQAKVWRSEIEHNVQNESLISSSNLQEKCDELQQELQFLKKQHQTDVQEEVEKERKKRKHIESKYASLSEDLEREKEKITSLKQKNSRMMAELEDTKIYANEQKMKAAELSRRQDGGGAGGVRELNEKVTKLKSERQKLQEEQENLVSENFSIKQELTDLQYENERLSEENRRLKEEVEELMEKQGDSGDAQIRRDYHALKLKSADQEDELNELSDQVKILEGTKNRLDMKIEAMRRDHAKELEEKEEEMSDMKSHLQRRQRETEAQLEEEYDTKRNLQREKTELENQLRTILDQRQVAVSDSRVKKLQKDLKRTKALLRDAQTVIDRQQNETASRSVLRQLKNQLEESEFQGASSAKALKTAQQDLEECREDLEQVTKTKNELEEKCSKLSRLNSELSSKVDDCDDELSEVMKKYRSAVDQQSTRSLAVDELHSQISELQMQNQNLKEEMATLMSKLDYHETNSVSADDHTRTMARLADVEASLDLEKTMRSRLENNVIRLKETVAQLTEDNDQLVVKERNMSENLKRSQRRISEIQEELNDAQKKEYDASIKNQSLENRVALLEDNLTAAESELKLATRRVNDLRGQLEEVNADDDDYLSDSDGFSDAESYASSEI